MIGARTEGEHRVGIDFNPSGNPEVDQVKGVVAALIDNIQPIVDTGGAAGRCAAIAQTKYEEAAMWAVKAITKPRST
jgi:hypothetical protein